ncbi:helicase-associated domain-containing protein [Ammonicoccus fulvus]|uniref:Helicase-associated domain-containing protein n=1 Tax=Ammonicoccus fulvus TaxID=3138240 RepID=A0ABZ3FNM7_9ACTN
MRDLTDALREFSAERLTALLTARADLAVPPPSDLADLATRAAAPQSVRRALDSLNRRDLTVAEAVAALPEPTSQQVADLVGFDARESLDRLTDLALTWAPAPGSIRAVDGLSRSFGPHPGGLAEPSAYPLDPDAIDHALTGLPDAAMAVVTKLMWGPPTGAVRNADRVVTDPVTPIDHLLARGLLRARDAHTVELPREVALRLRGGFAAASVAEPSPLPAGRRPARIVDSAAIGSAYEFVHQLEGILDELTRRTPAPLRTGGLAARDLTTLARAVGASPERVGFALEVARAAGLIVTTGPAIVPTDAFERWLALGPDERWVRVVRDWYAGPRWPALARTESGRPLGPDAEPGWAAMVRAAVLAPLAPGLSVDAERLAELAAWQRPAITRAGKPEDLVEAVLTEAGWLGLTAFEQVSSLVQALEGTLPDDIAARFPAFIDRLVLQADLTAIATGPLDRPTAAALALLADVESRGGGGVFRFHAGSVARAFEAGWSAQTIEEWLERHSSTGIPQPLRFLVADIARLHGTVRVGAARSYVRIDDPARLETVLAHPAAEELGVRRAGPETLVADADPADMVALLRELGLTPAAEGAAGDLLATPAPRRPPAPGRTRPRVIDAVGIAAILRTRAEAHESALATEDALTTLTRACAEAQTVEVDYVAADGVASRGVGVPTELAAGTVRLVGDDMLVLPLARVTAVRPAAT